MHDRPNESHPELSFELTVQNKAAPPCDLNSFMDYLVYVEHRAENLQFFLWYCDYVERWSRLQPRQRRLARPWGPTEAAEAAQADADAIAARKAAGRLILRELPQALLSEGGRRTSPKRGRPQLTIDTSAATLARSSPSHFRAATAAALSRRSTMRVATSIHKRSDSEKLTNILAILEDADDTVDSATSGWSSSSKGSPETSAISPRDDGLPPYTLQPCRDEVTRIVRHYIAAAGARALPDLFAPERAACLRAARHTTHPSALLPAFLAAEAALRTQSFPAFAQRWCVANTYGARLVACRILAVVLLLSGVVLDVLLITLPDRDAALARLACLALWWPALAALLASRHAIDLLLYARRRRMLHPWELDGDWGEAGRERDVGTTESYDDEDSNHNNNNDDDDNDDVEKTAPYRRHQHIASTASAALFTSSHLDPLRKPSMQALGPRNHPDAEPWAVWATTAPRHRRLLVQLWPATVAREWTIAVQHPGVRALQSRAVLVSVLWAGLASALLTVGSLFIPGPRL